MTPRVDAEERRREIIEAARRRFAENGYHGTSMDDIVAEAGLSKGTLYWYFENKQALFVAMVEALFADLAGAMEQIVSRDRPAGERLRTLVGHFLKLPIEEADLGDLLVTLWAETRHDEALVAYFRDMFQPFIDLLAALIEQGIASGEFRPVASATVAPAIAAIFDGLWVQAMFGLEIERYMDADALVDWMIDGLAPR